MNRAVIVAIAFAVLALGAGVAFAATQATASGGTDVCVNNTNGLVRVSDLCRDGEHPLTIGGGGATQVTQNGTFSVPWGQTGTGRVLPLTGVTISGRCDTIPPEFGEGGLPRALIEVASGRTMDIFADSTSPAGTGKTSALLPPAGGSGPGGVVFVGTRTAILTSNGATATITVGGTADVAARTCIFLWQAVEAPN
jgi:hypothetical protein